MRKTLLVIGLISVASLAYSQAPSPGAFPVPAQCEIPQQAIRSVLSQLSQVVKLPDGNGGLFSPNRMWAAIVDRRGVLCAVAKSDPDAWPGSRSIAIAKATAANGFSNDKLALSTTNLYAPTQPGGSLYGLSTSNPPNALFNAPANDLQTGTGFVVGGIITFGGGVALYSNGQVIGGLGVSGDSSCADHAIAYRMRGRAGFGTVPSGVAPDDTDNIIYAPSGTAPTGFEQPHCFPQDLTPAQVEDLSGGAGH